MSKKRPGAPVGNKNAAKGGKSIKVRVYVRDEDEEWIVRNALDPYARNLAIQGFWIWFESHESEGEFGENIPFLEWMEQKTAM